ncbi:MobA/MobL family protein [Legionella sp. WA2022007384]
MAIAFARISIHSRSKGHSAVAAISYRAGQKLIDSRTGITHDFSNRHDVVYSEVILPEDCDEAFLDREFLWNQVELAENRIDAQVCKDFVLALPKELDLVQQIDLVKNFAQVHFVENRLPADVAIHDHDDGNPHAHILIPTRRLEKEGFSKYKARDLNPAFAKGFVVEQDYWGEKWREFQNNFFKEHQIDLCVDFNHLIPERHHGTMKSTNNHYLLEENELIQGLRKELAKNHIEELLSHISSQHSVFTRSDIEKLLFKTMKNHQAPNEYLGMVERVLNHRHIIKLGLNDDGKEAYTTKITVGELLREFLEEAKSTKEASTYRGYKRVCEGHLLPMFDKVEIKDLQPALLRKWIKSLNCTTKIPLRIS